MRRLAVLATVGAALVAPVPAANAYIGVNLAGGEFRSARIPGRYGSDYIYPSPAHLDYYKRKGFELIRLPVLWERLQPVLYAPLSSEERARVESIVSAAQAHGMRVLLDVHNYGRREVNGVGYVIGSPEVPRSAFRDFWQRVAHGYRSNPGLWGYGLMNEPHDMGAYPWFDTAQAGITGVRSSDRNHQILVAGDCWSAAESWPSCSDRLRYLTGGSQLVYEAHQYFDAGNDGTYGTYNAERAYPKRCQDRVRPFVKWLERSGKRGFLGEYGVPGDDPRWLTLLDNCLAYLKQSGLGGTYWAGGPWWGNYPLSIEPKGGQDRPQMAVLERYFPPRMPSASPPPTTPVVPPSEPPSALTTQRVSSSAFAAGSGLPELARGLRTRATVSRQLADRAAVSLSSAGAARGRRAGRRCLDNSRKLRRRRRCTPCSPLSLSKSRRSRGSPRSASTANSRARRSCRRPVTAPRRSRRSGTATGSATRHRFSP